MNAPHLWTHVCQILVTLRGLSSVKSWQMLIDVCVTLGTLGRTAKHLQNTVLTVCVNMVRHAWTKQEGSSVIVHQVGSPLLLSNGGSSSTNVCSTLTLFDAFRLCAFLLCGTLISFALSNHTNQPVKCVRPVRLWADFKEVMMHGICVFPLTIESYTHS